MAGRLIDQAVVLLDQPELDGAAVHDVRVLMKQLRGLVRLYRDTGHTDVIKRINAILRDVAQVFSTRRDAHVLVETLQSVASASDKAVALQLQRIIEEVAEQTRDAMPDLEPQHLIGDLEAVRVLWRSELEQQGDADFLPAALRRSYRKNRKMGRQALKARDIEVLHDWRKYVKYLYFQLGVLEPENDWLERQRTMLRKLGSLLGKVHDLDMLNDYLCANTEADPRLLRAVHKRRVRLIKKVNALYGRAFVHSSRNFCRKLPAR
jgi:hypothetical protein